MHGLQKKKKKKKNTRTDLILNMCSEEHNLIHSVAIKLTQNHSSLISSIPFI